MSKRSIFIAALVGAMVLLGGYLYLTVSQGKYAARVPVHFRIHAPRAKTVFVAGSFNSWQTVEHLMEKSDQGTWTATISIAPGRYEYKFLVDTVWVLDADNPVKVPVPLPYGGYNSVLEVKPQ
jgi:1,4-alpha-glucan branching enzyme